MQNHERRSQSNISRLLLFGCQYQVCSHGYNDLSSSYLFVCISNPTNHGLSKQLMSILTRENIFFMATLYISSSYQSWGCIFMKKYLLQEIRFADKLAIHIWGEVLVQGLGRWHVYREQSKWILKQHHRCVDEGVQRSNFEMGWHFHE